MSREIDAFLEARMGNPGPNTSLPEDSQGAPLRRSPRGPAVRIADWAKSPEVRVWARPLFRAAGMMGVLGCVAFLGKQSEEESNYGAPIEMPSDVVEGEEGGGLASNAPPLEGEHSSQAEPESERPVPCAEEKKVQAPPAILPDGRIIMNEASQDDFTRLPGVGEARAKSIVELRTRMGKFRKVTDLLRVRGIGWKTLQAMKELLVVDRPPEEEKPPEVSSAESPPQGEVSQASPEEAAASGSDG